MTRRSVLRGTGLAALAALFPAELLSGCSRTTQVAEAGTVRYLVFDDHEAEVVIEASARLIPGPFDDPAEVGHPGAREADVVRFIDTMLGALSCSPAKVFAGGPFSNRAGWPTDDMAHFIGLGPAEAESWKARLSSWRGAYRQGIRALDDLLHGSFAAAANDLKDAALAEDPGGFTTLLFSHAIEAMYAPPEYGGNQGLVGWRDISFPGDVQPRGFSPSEVTDSDGPDPYRPDATATALLALIAGTNEQ